MEKRQTRWLATGLLVIVACFQVFLALGAPWGAFAFGGGNPGVLPTSMRVVSAVAFFVYSSLAYVIGSGHMTSRRAFSILAGVFLVGTLMNAISPSIGEKLLWTPVAGALTYALWRTRPDRSIEATSTVTRAA
jgi:hypothetical protein